MQQDLIGRYDTIVVGGGIMGCVLAHRLALAGQSVAVVDRGGLCMRASGVNAGTLSVQNKRPALVPYAMRGFERWRTARTWLGSEIGFNQVGGLMLAFTEDEAVLLTKQMAERREQGAPIEIVSPQRAQVLEPGLSDKPVLASWCPLDGYASSYSLGEVMRAALAAAGVTICEYTTATAVDAGDGEKTVHTATGQLKAARLVIAGGAWIEPLLWEWFGVRIPIICRVNQVSVTERTPNIFTRVISAATGLLTLKRASNGTVLIGGGWQGRGDVERDQADIVPENLIGNLRLATFAVPGLRGARLVRSWLGFEGVTEDGMPLAGSVPGQSGAYVLGCAKGGFTIGPCLGELLAEHILGSEPELPLFDPTRLVYSKRD